MIDVLKQNPEIKAFIHGNVGDGSILGKSDEALNQTGFDLNKKKNVPAKALMSARALAIYNFLIEQGVNPKQLDHGTGQVNKGADYNVTFELKIEGNK